MILDVVGWISTFAVVYLLIGMLCGCPYCGKPDLQWPLNLVRRLRRDQEDDEAMN